MVFDGRCSESVQRYAHWHRILPALQYCITVVVSTSIVLLRSLNYVVQAPHELTALSVALAHIKSAPDLPTAPQPTGASHSALESPPPPPPSATPARCCCCCCCHSRSTPCRACGEKRLRGAGRAAAPQQPLVGSELHLIVIPPPVPLGLRCLRWLPRPLRRMAETRGARVTVRLRLRTGSRDSRSASARQRARRPLGHADGRGIRRGPGWRVATPSWGPSWTPHGVVPR